MKKILTKFLPLLLLISLISCNQLVVGIEKTFSYWANGATIIGIELPPNTPVDGEGFFSLPSGQDARICFKLNNPQKFEFLMPGDSNAPADIIVFDGNVRGKNEGRPELGEGKDYSLIQKSSDTLELTYTKEFLLKNEQGKANLNPKIKLYNKKDNRRFAQNYNYKLRANTVPPKPEWVTTGKIKDGENWYYVLIFKFEGLASLIDTGNLLHGDISEVYLTEGESQKAPIQVKLTNNGFDVSDSQGNLIPQDAAITALATTDIAGGGPTSFESIPNANARKWMLCIKTGVKTGDSLSYEVEVKDLRGLASKTSGVTNAAKLPVPQISYDSGMAALTSSGVYTDNETVLSTGTSANPILISSCFGNTVVLKAHNIAYSSDVTIVAEVKLSASTQPSPSFTGPTGSSQQDVNTTKILLDPIPGVDEIYEVKVKASASGSNYTDSDEKTYYYQIKKEVRAGTSSWQILKNAVNLASDRDTIYINGHIKSTSTANNSGEIEVSKNINIKGSTGKINDIINANKVGSYNPSPTHRIFKIKSGGSLNLTGLTLQDGKADTGGAILAETGSTLTLNNTDIKYSEASNGGGAISTGGTLIINGGSVISGNMASNSTGIGGAINISALGTLIMKGGTIADNTAKTGGAVYNNGTFEISGSAKIVPSADTDENKLGKNDVYLPMGKVITVTGVLTQTSVARISPVTPYTAGRQVVKGDSGVILSSQVSRFKVTDDTYGKKWKINAAGLLELANKTITVTSWKELKEAVQNSSENGTIIINGNIKAVYSNSDAKKWGTIEVKKNLTIKGNNISSQNIIELDLATFIGGGLNKKHKIFKISNNAVVKLENLELKNGYSKDSGGGIEIVSGNVTLSKVTIDNCTAKANGGGIIVRGGSLKIENGSLIQNCKAIKDTTSSSAVANGGGIFVGEHGTLELDGIRIYKNSADKNDGGGIYTKGTINIVSATIEENSSISSGGGGIYIEDGTCTIGNTATGNIIIKNNKSDLGAGIYIHRGTLGIQRGLIENNSTEEGKGFKYGGGLYLANGTVNMSGGEIKTNSAELGGALYFENGTFKMSGSAKITPSTDEDEHKKGKNDVYLPMGKVITVTGVLTQTSVARITPADNTYTAGRQVVEGDPAASPPIDLSSQVSKFKVTNDPDGKKWKVNAAGKLEEDNQGKIVTSWGDLKQEVEKTSGGAEVIIVGGTFTAGGASDEIKVKRDVTIKGKDSHAILNADERCRIFSVLGTCKLTLENITLTKGKPADGQSGGAIFAASQTTLILDNTHILSNILEHNNTYGAGVRLLGTVIMKNGSHIDNNIITGNGKGAGISAKDLTIEDGCVLSGNINNQGMGGAIFVALNHSLIIKGSSTRISGNKAKEGGGIYMAGSLTMEDGSIENNEATGGGFGHGGAIYHAGDIFSMSSSAKITPSANPNEHTHGKNDVYLSNNKTIKITETLDAGQNQAARITVSEGNYSEGKVVLEGAGTVNLSNEAKKFKVTKKGGQSWYVGNNGKLTTTAPGP